jgi:D-alanine--poly(phosphoribitol) ligase subunit 2
MRHTELVELLIDCIKDLNESLEQPVSLDHGESTPLYGRDGTLDSLALVTLIMDFEQAIHDKSAVSLTLASEKAMAQTSSPFRTVGSLADYAVQLIEEQCDHE